MLHPTAKMHPAVKWLLRTQGFAEKVIMSTRNQSLESRIPGLSSGVAVRTATGLLVIALAVWNAPQTLAQKEPARSGDHSATEKREPVGSIRPAMPSPGAAGLNAEAAGLVDAMAASAAQRDAVQRRTAIFVMKGGDPGRTFVDLLESQHRCKCTLVTSDQIRSGALASFEVVLVPGGRASKQFADLGEEGRQALRRFVEDGGGYVGVCAGGYLASYLGLVSAKTLGKNAKPGPDTPKSVDVRPSGGGIVIMELTDAGRKVLGELSGPLRTLFSGGPIFRMSSQTDVSECVCLARYRSEVSFKNFPPGTMTGTPAILAAQFGKGRVIAFSPHPECVPQGVSPGVASLVVRAVLATARRPVDKKTGAHEGRQ